MSRVAVAHEAVVESFIASRAVLPMKLFTIFKTDERALEHVRSQRARIATLVKRVANQQEWGVRVVLDRTLAAAAPKQEGRGGAHRRRPTWRRRRRSATPRRSSRPGPVKRWPSLFDRLAARSGDAKRRSASELPAQGGPLLLDAAFLVPRARAAAFKALVARESQGAGASGLRR